MPDSNLYDILDVTQNASSEEITLAYRRLASKYHPDRSKALDAVARMQAILHAYEILSDPDRRTRYDTDPGSSNRGNPAREAEVALRDLLIQALDFATVTRAADLLNAVQMRLNEMIGLAAKEHAQLIGHRVRIKKVMKGFKRNGCAGDDPAGPLYGVYMGTLDKVAAALATVEHRRDVLTVAQRLLAGCTAEELTYILEGSSHE